MISFRRVYWIGVISESCVGRKEYCGPRSNFNVVQERLQGFVITRGDTISINFSVTRGYDSCDLSGQRFYQTMIASEYSLIRKIVAKVADIREGSRLEVYLGSHFNNVSLNILICWTTIAYNHVAPPCHF